MNQVKTDVSVFARKLGLVGARLAELDMAQGGLGLDAVRSSGLVRSLRSVERVGIEQGGWTSVGR